VRRLLTRGPNDEAVWRTVHVRPIDERWVAMIHTDGDQPPGPNELRGIALFSANPEAAEAMVLEYLKPDAEHTQRGTSP
jgi:hypothetical protein